MQRDLQDDERKAFEQYLLAGKDQTQVQKALSNLVPGSVPHSYLHFVNLLTREGGIKSEEDSTKFNKFTSQGNTRNSPEARQLKLWNLLKSYDNEPANRPTILDELVKDYADFQFDHQKPELPEGIKAAEAESSQDEDDAKHTLPADFFVFSNQKIIEEQAAELEKSIAQIKTAYTDEKDLVRETRRVTTNMLCELWRKGDGIWQ